MRNSQKNLGGLKPNAGRQCDERWDADAQERYR